MTEPVDGQTFHDVIALEELKEGEIYPLSVAGLPVVLVRRGETVRALGGKCPHKGAPMEQGAFCQTKEHGDVVVCPWHKSVFDVTTGAVVEPVAFAPLPVYPVEVIQGRVLVGVIAEAVLEPEPVKPDETVLIIGGGGAAASAVYTLRQGGFAGPITMVCQEKKLPYNRTALSKTVLLSDPEKINVPVLLDEAYYKKHNVTTIYDSVTAFDSATHVATLASGQTVRGGSVILAMGASPNDLGLPGGDLAGVRHLNTIEDAHSIADEVRPEDAVVLMGGGFICLEVASSLRQKGVGVTIISPEAVPMEGQFGRELGSRLLQLHEENSVAFIYDSRVTRIVGEGRVKGVELDDGTILSCSHVIPALGGHPESAIITDLPKSETGALLVDEAMRVKGNIYAAGDVAALKWGGKTWGFMHWRHALVMGRIAARSILGDRVNNVPTPWFWTQQFGKKLEYLGWGEPFDHVVIEGDLRSFEFLATFRNKERVVGLVGSGKPAEMAEAAVNYRKFIREEIGEVPV
ncbi:FAD-dependent oxidoreductase [Acetobacteraceae bacterium ESL0709]|nr:FAD-dependent oxidoreductase [Acetobacteraceae bacterium ESL0697]MDF7677673.1 FAD-dependent oxidoreductase [Acetobacteraceae bacterium ESL0709]